MKRQFFIAAMALALLATPALAQNATTGNNNANNSLNGPSQRLQMLRSDMDRLFSRFFHDNGNGQNAFDMDFGGNPAVDVVDHGDNYVVSAQVPGMDVSNLDVSVAGSRLILRGQEQTAKSDDKFIRHETISGAFDREITLPDNADLSKADATYKDGMLTITIPKSAAAANARKLPIKKLD